jgi:hypothetical protein
MLGSMLRPVVRDILLVSTSEADDNVSSGGEEEEGIKEIGSSVNERIWILHQNSTRCRQHAMEKEECEFLLLKVPVSESVLFGREEPGMLMADIRIGNGNGNGTTALGFVHDGRIV